MKLRISWLGASGLRSAVILSVIALVLTACSADPPETTVGGDEEETTEEETEEGAEETTSARSGGTLTVVSSAEPTTLNPFTYQSRVELVRINALYDTLVEYDLETPEFSVKPALAENWELSDDGLTITLDIRDDVKFHDGSVFTAEDAKFSIDQARKPEAAKTTSLLAAIESTEAIDEETVEIRLSQPDRIVLNALTIVSMVPDGASDFDDAPVGTGPFAFVEWDQGQNRITLEGHEEYWREGQPYLDEVVFKVVAEPATQVLQLTNGEIDMIVPEAPFTQVEQLQSAGMQLPTLPSEGPIGYYDLRLNTRVEPWDDERVRQALAYAIDREAVKEALLGQMVVTSRAIPEDNPFYNPDAPSYEHDVERAKELLAEAGHPDGVSGTMLVGTFGSNYEIASQVVAESVKAAGIELEMETVDVATWLDRFYSQQDFEIAGVIGFVTAPYVYDTLATMYDSNDSEAIGWAENQEGFQEQLTEARSYVDDDKFREAMFELQARGMEGASMIIVGGQVRAPALAPYVKGFTLDPELSIPLNGVWLDK